MQEQQGAGAAGCRSSWLSSAALSSTLYTTTFLVGAENPLRAHLPAPLCHPIPHCPHGHLGMSGTGHPLRLTPREGSLHPLWVSVGLLPA